MKLPIALACGLFDRRFGLRDATVPVGGVDRNFPPMMLIETRRRQARHAEFDASEFGIYAKVSERNSGDNVAMNEKQPTQPIEAQLAEVQRKEAQPVEAQNQDPRRRLRELLAIPDRERTDALWDEIVRLEIELAPENRAPSTQADAGRRLESGRRQEPGRRPEQVRRQEAKFERKPGKRFLKRPKRGLVTPTKT